MGKLKPGETFFTETKWMIRNNRAKIMDFPERVPYRLTIEDGQPQFVFLQPGTISYFQRGQKRYLCKVLRLAGYATRRLVIPREFKFIYEVKVIE